MYKRYFYLYLALLLFISILFAYDIKAENKKEYKASIDNEGIQRVEITGGEYYFDPDHIIVKVNVPVEFSVRKKPSIVPHNIIIKEPDAGIEFNVSLKTKPKVIKFIPKKTGRFPFYCDKKFLFFKSHREKGMEGVLEVVE